MPALPKPEIGMQLACRNSERIQRVSEGSVRAGCCKRSLRAKRKSQVDCWCKSYLRGTCLYLTKRYRGLRARQLDAHRIVHQSFADSSLQYETACLDDLVLWPSSTRKAKTKYGILRWSHRAIGVLADEVLFSEGPCEGGLEWLALGFGMRLRMAAMSFFSS